LGEDGPTLTVDLCRAIVIRPGLAAVDDAQGQIVRHCKLLDLAGLRVSFA
jgi:hypothetical protein|tara:strand:- start:1115 stop:1264 length:150 start_codon:yes stop_codon:yes gene_type:complete